MKTRNYENKRNLQIICPKCEGDGFIIQFKDCGLPAWSCCGGCAEEVRCTTCEGVKEIEPFDEVSEHDIRMIKALEYRKEKFKSIIKMYLMPEDLTAEYSIGKLKNEMKRNDQLTERIKEEIIIYYESKNGNL